MPAPSEGRRVVITGMGGLTPLGNSVQEFWQGCVEGRSGIGPITLVDTTDYPVKFDGEVRNFDPQDYMDRKEARRMARFSQLGVAAARMAIDDAELKIEKEDVTRIGVFLGNGNGGYPETNAAVVTIVTKGGNRLDPLYMSKCLPNMASAQVALQFGLKGYNNTATTACAASTQAMGDALDVIRLGRADVMIAGGSEAGICELGLAAFNNMHALSRRQDDPTKVSRPYDKDRDGFVCAEGAGLFVFESLEHAQRRGARILAEIAGYAASADAYHVVAPCADGEGAARTMRWALEDAGMTIEDVDYISAHGTSTPAGDTAETIAIKTVFGELAYRIPVSSTKSMIGHTLGASGGVESLGCIMAIQTGIVPPTTNYETLDPDCDLDYVPNKSRNVGEVRTVLKNSFGFGGQNACLIFTKFEE